MLLAFAAMASLGLPGLAGFWGEMLALFSATDPAAGLTRRSYIADGCGRGLGLVLTAAYLLTVVPPGLHGRRPPTPRRGARWPT